MKTSESIANLSKDLIKLQGQLQNIGEDSTGYGYKYTSLEKLLQYVRPLMAKNKIGVVQMPVSQDGKIGVTTRLIHESGEFLEETLTMDKTNLAKMNDYQVAGSAITYFRRYALSSILGIASDDDVDSMPPPPKELPQHTKIDEAKSQLVKKLKAINYDMGNIKAFAQFHNLENDLERIEVLLNDDELFNNAVANFENPNG